MGGVGGVEVAGWWGGDARARRVAAGDTRGSGRPSGLRALGARIWPPGRRAAAWRCHDQASRAGGKALAIVRSCCISRAHGGSVLRLAGQGTRNTGARAACARHVCRNQPIIHSSLSAGRLERIIGSGREARRAPAAPISAFLFPRQITWQGMWRGGTRESEPLSARIPLHAVA